MKSEDDPEARIRELEQPLAEAARASEAAADQSPSKWAPPSGPPVPPPLPLAYSGPFSGPSAGTPARGQLRWILVALFVIGVMSLPVAIFLFGKHEVSRSALPSMAPIPSVSSKSPTASRTIPSTPGPATPDTSVTTAPAGENVTVSGINEVRTIHCDGGGVSISGITNIVTVTGHCASVNVSGIQNQLTLDVADSIQASGSGNRVTFHTGTPKIAKSGFDNVVQKG